MTVTIEGQTPGITVDGEGAVVNVTVTTGAGAGGGTTMPSGTAGQVPQVQSGSTYELVTPNTPEGLVRLNESGTIPDVLIPSTIARDSEVTAAIEAALDAVVPDVTTIPYVVTGNVTIATLEAALGLIAAGVRFLLGHSALLVDSGGEGTLGLFLGGAVTGGAAGVWEWDGSDLVYVRAAAAGDLLATSIVVDQAMTWSPENNSPVPTRSKERWPAVWPGVAIAWSKPAAVSTVSPSPSSRSGR